MLPGRSAAMVANSECMIFEPHPGRRERGRLEPVTSATKRGRSPSRWLVAVSACVLCAVSLLAGFSLAEPAVADASSPTPLIIDTDIFSDADDVGALATAFALQIQGEDQVIAITVNTRLSRPSVATKSWKCAAAIAQYYGSPNVPIGADLPDNGSQVGSPDFLTPCAALASPSTPAPGSAVSTLRQALVDQADGSVVIAETGYEENLEALLSSPADSISPLTGAQLVAQKVKTLDIMGGQYPSSPSPENNLAGNPGAAEYVAANWPTKVVYSGNEVGGSVYAGRTIDSAQPVNSPVRAAYDAYANGSSIQSWDLTAVYHAVRPNDAALTEIGPGQNAIDGSGNDVFTTGAGNQDYLSLTNLGGLESSLESLLDVLPSGTVTPPPVPVDNVPPSITGATSQGQTLTEIAGSWSNSPTSYTYQWQDCDSSGAHCKSISGATGQTYTLAASDVGSTIRVLETAHNSGGAGTAATSAATAVVSPPAPVDISPPAIAGTVGQGQTLTETPGSWSSSPTSYSYQWQDCNSSGAACQTITGATNQTYTLTANDVGSTIRVLETAHNSGGAGTAAASPATAVVSPPAPADISPPAITGTAATGTNPHRDPRHLVKQPGRLQLPMAGLQQLRRSLPNDHRSHQPDVHAHRKRRRIDDPRARDRPQQRRRRNPRNLRSHRTRDRPGEHGRRFSVQDLGHDARHSGRPARQLPDQLEAPQRDVRLQGDGPRDRLRMRARAGALRQARTHSVPEVPALRLDEDLHAPQGRPLRAVRASDRRDGRGQEARHGYLQDHLTPSRGSSRCQGDGCLFGCDVEAEALFEIEPHQLFVG